MPAFFCQAQHCYHAGTVFRGRYACCRCETEGAVLERDPEGAPGREEKTHGFIGSNAGTQHHPIYSSIDLKIAEALRTGDLVADSGDLADLLRLVKGLNDRLKAAPPAQSPILVVRR